MADEIFDPEIHAVDPKTGEPSLNKDGSFRKKRKDAGARKVAAPKPSGSGGNSARARYQRSVDNALAPLVAVGSIVDPVLGFAGGLVAPLWSEALADLAVENPRVAAALEKVGNVGAVGGVLGAAILTGVQFGHLLGKVPAHVAKMVGAKTRDEIEQMMEQRGMELAAQSQRQAAEETPAEGLAAEAEGAREHARA